MAYYLLYPLLNTKKSNHNGKNKEYNTEPGGSCGIGQGISLWLVPPISHAVQGRHDEGGQCKDAGDL